MTARILILFLLLSHPLVAQESPPTKVVTDTIQVKKNSIVLTPDSVFFSKKDTVLYIVDTLKVPTDSVLKPVERQPDSVLYQKIEQRMKKKKIGRRLFDLLFDIDVASSTSTDKESEPEQPARYQGMIVGDITVKQIDVFGPSVTDTAQQAGTRLSRLYNDFHVNTHSRVLRNNLLLKKGDVLNRNRVADNERIIRSLPFIRDARLLVQPRADSDTADLLLVTEDVVPYSFAVNPNGIRAADFTVRNNNILGTGHELENTAIVETREDQKLGYQGTYRVPNIGRSFVQSEVQYTNTSQEEIYRGTLFRPLVVPTQRYGGGIQLNYSQLTTLDPRINSYTVLDSFPSDSITPLISYTFLNQDYWLARSFELQDFDERTRLIFALRFDHDHFYERPEVAFNLNTAYHHRSLLLGSVGFSKRYYTTEQLVYAYGRTEDIPLGQRAELIAGPEYGEYYNRFFTGARYERGNYVTPVGYLTGGLVWGGFWRNQQLEDGMFQASIRGFSYLIYRRRTRFRLFLQATYTQGIRRQQTINLGERFVDVSDRNGIRGLRSRELEGNERLGFKFEAVMYPPFDLYSFRMAGFAFVDAGFIAPAGESIVDTKPYQGFGLGVRIRNENLAFKTFQVRVAVYPGAPDGKAIFGFQIGGIPQPRFQDFAVGRPEVFPFR